MARTKGTGPDELSVPVRRCLFLGEQASHDRFEAAIPPLTTSLQYARSIKAENATRPRVQQLDTYEFSCLLCALDSRAEEVFSFFNILGEKEWRRMQVLFFLLDRVIDSFGSLLVQMIILICANTILIWSTCFFFDCGTKCF